MKAKVKYIITIGGLLLCSGLRAQTVSMGAEGELTTTEVKISGIPNSLIRIADTKNMMGYEVGPYFKLDFGNVYIKSKLLVSYQSGIIQAVYPDQNAADVTIVVTKLDVPILVGVKIFGPLSVEGGPLYSRLLSATTDYNGNNIDLKPDGFGYRMGANLKLGIVGFNVDYQHCENNASGSGTFSSFEIPNELVFGVSLRLFGPAPPVVPYGNR